MKDTTKNKKLMKGKKMSKDINNGYRLAHTMIRVKDLGNFI